MADASKAQQLLAARKKLKEFQKNKKSRTTESQGSTVENRTPVESLTNSTHSSLNEVSSEQNNKELANMNVSPLQNYFTSQNHNTSVQPINFFDNITARPKQPEDFYAFNSVNYARDNGYVGDVAYVEGVNNYNQTVKAAEQLESSDVSKISTDDVRAMEYPEINPNEIYDRLHKKPNESNSETFQSYDDLHDSLRKVEPFTDSLPKHENIPTDNTVHVNNLDENRFPSERESMESLKQLSTQIIQLIDDNSISDTALRKNFDLETENQELIAALQKERNEKKQIEVKVLQLEEHVSQLEKESQTNNEELLSRYNRELSKLEEKLQCHQQTVNILVGEKAELSNRLLHNETLAKLKLSECEELNARLKTSRSRVADLEKELNALRTEKSKNDKKGLEQTEEYISLANELHVLKEQREEALQDISELQEKLHTNTAENLRLQHEIQNLASQLSMATVKVQQLSVQENSQVNDQIDRLTQQNGALEKQILELHNTAKLLQHEKDQANLQYQQYVQLLNGQLNGLNQKLEARVKENESLVLREQELTTQMGELEKLLQRLQNEQLSFSSNKGNSESRKEVEEALHVTKVLQDEKLAMDEKYSQIITERDELFRELDARKSDIVHLEDLVQQLQSDQPDNTKLLATMESDKVAASRAVAQNAELKKQLEEMQDVFIKMSNDKLELTEKLDVVQHRNRELDEKLNQFESQIHTLTDAIDIKDKEMVSMREKVVEFNKYVLQQNQLEDRLMHYEAHDRSTHALQHELQESYIRIEHLKIENEKLQTTIENKRIMESRAKNATVNINVEESSREGDKTELKIDKVALQNKIAELERVNKDIEVKLKQVETQNVTLKNNNNLTAENTNEPLTVSEDTDDSSVLSKEIATRHLEEKFTKTMQDIANLQDEKQRLEHLVLQLQDETETIGEYITLYQHQRGVLKQRSLEREEQLRQLTLDREQMKKKLDQLNQLVRVLLAENGVIPPELLDHQAISAHMLCNEHAKIHEKLNNITQAGERVDLEDATKSETAEKIIELLSEIKTSNLVQPSDTAESFHPCPVCSGQLITV